MWTLWQGCPVSGGLSENREERGSPESSRAWLGTSFGTGPQQVDHVQVGSEVTHDLQLRHKGLLLAASGCS